MKEDLMQLYPINDIGNIMAVCLLCGIGLVFQWLGDRKNCWVVICYGGSVPRLTIYYQNAVSNLPTVWQASRLFFQDLLILLPTIELDSFDFQCFDSLHLLQYINFYHNSTHPNYFIICTYCYFYHQIPIIIISIIITGAVFYLLISFTIYFFIFDAWTCSAGGESFWQVF